MVDYLYLNGLYKAKATSLFSQSHFDHLATLNREGIIKYLLDLGYAQINTYDLEKITEEEIAKEIKELQSLLPPTHPLLKYLLFAHDTVIIKTLYKSKIFHLEVTPFTNNSFYPFATWHKAIIEGNSEGLGKEKALIEIFDQQLTAPQAARCLSDTISQVVYHYLYQEFSAEPELQQLMVEQATLTNLITLIRAMNFQDALTSFQSSLLPHTFIDQEVYQEAFTSRNILHPRIVQNVNPLVVAALDQYQKSGNLPEVEKAFRDYLLLAHQEVENKALHLGAIVNYFFRKLEQITRIRQIYFGANNQEGATHE